MPELPEVETTRRGIAPHLRGRRIVDWRVRNPDLRWPVSLPEAVKGQSVMEVSRRGKYLLVRLETGSLILHLGMSGSLRVLPVDEPAQKHDHVDLLLDSGALLRLNDPRRFGSIHWQQADAGVHWLLARLGVEPLSEAFDGAYLKWAARGRRLAVKNLLMDARVVVGIGNIYANESLFLARIRPSLPAHRVTRASCDRLAGAVKSVLEGAIAQGGTTLRNFVDHDGRPGYFKQSLNVYGREGLPCRICQTALRELHVSQRATVFCPKCQRAQGFAGG